MGMIFKEIEISGLNVKDKKLIALFDTGTKINSLRILLAIVFIGEASNRNK
ncbi:hypothetical protein ES703_101458 [subsurface metagenome]